MNPETIIDPSSPSAKFANQLSSWSQRLEAWSEKSVTPEEVGYTLTLAMVATISILASAHPQLESFIGASRLIDYLTNQAVIAGHSSSIHLQQQEITQALANSYANGALGRVDDLTQTSIDHLEQALLHRDQANNQIHLAINALEIKHDSSKFLGIAGAGILINTLLIYSLFTDETTNRPTFKSPKRSTHVLPLLAKTLSTCSKTLTKKPNHKLKHQ